jgi:hypothetical protein
VGSLYAVYRFVRKPRRMSELALGHVFGQPSFPHLVAVNLFRSHRVHIALLVFRRQIFWVF